MRNVLISGGTRGVGLAIARKLAADGYSLSSRWGARNPMSLKAAIAEVSRRVMNFVPFDLANVDVIPDPVREMKAEHGPLYGLVNNAALGTEGLLVQHAQFRHRAAGDDQHHRAHGAEQICRARHDDGGRGPHRQHQFHHRLYRLFSGLSVYGATKASMLGFTRSLAREVGRLGVTVNAVAPGFMDTEMTAGMTDDQRAKIAGRAALKRLVDVEDVGQAVAFLMSDAARNITGTTITVDAGNTA